LSIRLMQSKPSDLVKSTQTTEKHADKILLKQEKYFSNSCYL
jgi:hypothetical protein